MEKQLVVYDEEGNLVRHIFQRYLALGCVRALQAELDRDDYLSKLRSEHHKSQGRNPLSRGALYTVLKNPDCIGKLHQKGKHAAMVIKYSGMTCSPLSGETATTRLPGPRAMATVTRGEAYKPK